ncbi:hypothetical protein L0222_18235 [bacterium]|nr:hypothetical protein [bacterium]
MALPAVLHQDHHPDHDRYGSMLRIHRIRARRISFSIRRQICGNDSIPKIHTAGQVVFGCPKNAGFKNKPGEFTLA